MKIKVTTVVTPSLEDRLEDLYIILEELNWVIDQPEWMWYKEGINNAILRKMHVKKEIRQLEKELGIFND